MLSLSALPFLPCPDCGNKTEVLVLKYDLENAPNFKMRLKKGDVFCAFCKIKLVAKNVN